MAKEREVTIRMYKQGLGDCFLLTFPRKPKPFRMLIDCGALKSSRYKPDSIRPIVTEIGETTGHRLDVLAATHEHWDHISGFSDARAEFDAIEVESVWVAWTEDPKSKAAKLLKQEFKKGKAAVEKALTRMTAASGTAVDRYKQAIAGLLEFSGGVGAAKTTGDAWAYILDKAPNLYCDPKKAPLELEGVDGVRAYILGPPEDPSRVRQLLSKKETYDDGHPAFAAFAGFLGANGDDTTVVERALPFAPRYRIPAKKARALPSFQTYYAAANAWRNVEDEWLGLTGELALHLDSYTNNTCLAFAIELGEDGPVLLFPGDAQVGNWLSWQERSWTVKSKTGEKRKVTGADLLSRTVFYKVGHHGSHNATMRGKGLEIMDSPDLVAMIPVHRATAGDQKWEFPYGPLWNRLKEKARGRVLLADAELEEIEPELKVALKKSELGKFKSATQVTEKFVEYKVSY